MVRRMGGLLGSGGSLLARMGEARLIDTLDGMEGLVPIGPGLVVGRIIGMDGTGGRGAGVSVKGRIVAVEVNGRGVVGRVVVWIGVVRIGIVRGRRGGLDKLNSVSLNLTCRLSLWATRLSVSFSVWTV